MVSKRNDLLATVRLLNHETPYFFTSKKILKENYENYTGLFDNSEIYYALKANSDPKVLKYLDSLGCGFEAASGYEIKALLDVGVDPKKIIYGTSIKPPKHIQWAHRWGVDRFAADSKEEIEKIAKYAPGARVYIRTIVDDTGSVFMMSVRFGAPAHNVRDLMLYARSLGLKLYGISFYVGSQAAHANMWAKGIHVVRPIIEQLADKGIMLEALNIGGGFPVTYTNHRTVPELYEIVANTHNALHMLPYIPKLIMEPGRGIVATSTVLVAEVIARNDRANRPWLCLDAGIYNALYEAMIHQGATGYIVRPYDPPEGRVKMMTCTVAGPTGDSLDIITHRAKLPASTDVGDKLIFENAGAYTLALAGPFNGFPTPPLYMS